MKRVSGTFAILSALTFGTVWANAAAAQSLELPENGAIQSSPSFSQEEIQTFAVASLDVERINDHYQTKLQATADPDEQADIAVEAEEQMMQSVQDKGLSVERYNSIVLAARGDQSLARQILELRSVQTPEYP